MKNGDRAPLRATGSRPVTGGIVLGWKRAIAVALILLAPLLTVTVTSASATPYVVSFDVEPESPRVSDEITVRLVLGNTENVTSVRLTYCHDLRTVPFSMEGDGVNYTYTFLAYKFKPGNVTLTVIVEYSCNGTTETLEENRTVAVAAIPLPDEGGSGHDTPGFGAVPVVSTFVVTAILTWTVRRRRR